MTSYVDRLLSRESRGSAQVPVQLKNSRAGWRGGTGPFGLMLLSFLNGSVFHAHPERSARRGGAGAAVAGQGLIQFAPLRSGQGVGVLVLQDAVTAVGA